MVLSEDMLWERKLWHDHSIERPTACRLMRTSGIEKQMSVWFTKNLGDAMLAGESLEHIKTLFLSAYEQAENAKEMALFVRHESEGRLHCEVKIYFSPASAFVAEAVDATPCKKPSPDSLDLLAGSEASWSVFFP